LLARLLSERAPTAPSSPKTPSSFVGSSPLLAVPSSSTSAVGVCAAVAAPSSCAVMSSVPCHVRRTSPISIPKRAVACGSGHDDGVRYRKAHIPSREELEEEERDRLRAIAMTSSTRSSSASCAPKRETGEFTFAECFAPSVSRAMAIPSVRGKSNGRIQVVSYTPSLSVTGGALPSSMLDGFLAL